MSGTSSGDDPTRTTPGHRPPDVILVGGSQGSVKAVPQLLSGLPANFGAAIAITIHRSPTFVSALAEMFSRHSKLPVVEPRTGCRFEKGMVFLAPRDHHLVFRSGAIWLDRGPKHHFARPAIDVMFASGAATFGPRVIGVLLTGNMSDGVAGLVAIKERGGLSLAQDPREADAPSMPRNAVLYDDVDAVFGLEASAELLVELVAGVGIKRAAGAQALPAAGERRRPASP